MLGKPEATILSCTKLLLCMKCTVVLYKLDRVSNSQAMHVHVQVFFSSVQNVEWFYNREFVLRGTPAIHFPSKDTYMYMSEVPVRGWYLKLQY